MTCFDDLSTDLLLNIFTYLTYTEIFQTFFGLKKCLNDAIRDYPIHIDLSKIMNCLNAQQFPLKCRSIVLTGLNLPSFQMKYSYLNLTSLRVVTFKKMDLITLHSFIEKLPMKQLESITVEYFTWHYYPIDAYKQIWSIIMNSINGNCLRYLHLPYHIRYWNIEKNSYYFSNLKYAILDYISVSQMLTFMSYSPNLHRFKAFIDGPNKDIFRYIIILSKLNHLTLNLQDEWTFEEIQQLLTICPYLKHLILKLKVQREIKNMFEPISWQTLIDNKLPYLTFLRLHLDYIIDYSDKNFYNFQETFNHDEYWLQQQPHFQVTINIIQQEVL